MSKDRPFITRTVKRLKRLEGAAKIKFGTVATLTPFTVYLDGDLDDDDLPIATPATPMVTATIGGLVVCVEQQRRVIVIAAS